MCHVSQKARSETDMDAMIHTGINLTINYIWLPLAWIFGTANASAVITQTTYLCKGDCPSISKLVVGDGKCDITTRKHDITGECKTDDSFLVIKDGEQEYKWLYKQSGELAELFDEQSGVWVRLEKQKNQN